MKTFSIIAAVIIFLSLSTYIDSYKEAIISGLSSFFGLFITLAVVIHEFSKKSKEDEDYYR